MIKCINKLYTYCVRNKNKYGLLSTVNKSWLFRVESGTLCISELIKPDNLLQQVYNLINLAKDDPNPDTFIPPIERTDLPLGAFQFPPSSNKRGGGKRQAKKQNEPDKNNTVKWENPTYIKMMYDIINDILKF